MSEEGKVGEMPENCTHRLRAEGKPAPRSGCVVQGCRMGGMARVCPMIAASAPTPSADGASVVVPVDLVQRAVIALQEVGQQAFAVDLLNTLRPHAQLPTRKGYTAVNEAFRRAESEKTILKQTIREMNTPPAPAGDAEGIEHDEAGWWFWDEIQAHRMGPYASEEEARKKLSEYAVFLDTGQTPAGDAEASMSEEGKVFNALREFERIDTIARSDGDMVKHLNEIRRVTQYAIAHLRAPTPSADGASVVDEAVALLRAAPVLMLDRAAVEARGEAHMLTYMDLLDAWMPRVKSLLTTPPAPAGDAEAMRFPDNLAELIERELMAWRGANGGIYTIRAAALGVSIMLRALAPQRAREGGEVERLREALEAERARANGWRDKFNADTEEIAGLRRALSEAVATIEDYLSYSHDGDPWKEDARVMGEMDINDYARDGRLERARAALTPTPTAREEPDIGGLDGGEDGEPEGDAS